jgi:Mitochondrial carrier protein
VYATYIYTTYTYCRLFVTTMMNPFDVVSTRMYSQSAKHAVYSGPIDCFVKTFRAEGIKGFYKVSSVSCSAIDVLGDIRPLAAATDIYSEHKTE